MLIYLLQQTGISVKSRSFEHMKFIEKCKKYYFSITKCGNTNFNLTFYHKD